MSGEDRGLLASYEHLDSTVAAIRELRRQGIRDITVYSPLPEHHLEEAVGLGESPVRVFTLVGGLTGAATGFALGSWTAVDWPLVTGGKPIVSIPPFVVIAFELMVLFGTFATVIGLFLNARLPKLRPKLIYDPEFSAGRFGVHVTGEGPDLLAAREILEVHEPLSIREQGEESAHAS